ncbi:MAG: beta-glucosidase [Psychromonas sp.]
MNSGLYSIHLPTSSLNRLLLTQIKRYFFIGRTAGEDQDCADAAGSYRLTDVEMLMIEKVNTYFDQIIIVLNVTNIMDMYWLESIKNKQSIQAVLYSRAAGMQSGHTLTDILCGAISPSVCLSKTIAYQLSDYPSSANFGCKDYNLYIEDIYLGYRYFETFNSQAVQYGFGRVFHILSLAANWFHT